MTDPDSYLQEVMTLFLGRFSPCDSIANATHFFSTDEIHRAMHELNPRTKVEKEAVYQMMRDSGFRFQFDDQKFSLTLKWLLTAR